MEVMRHLHTKWIVIVVTVLFLMVAGVHASEFVQSPGTSVHLYLTPSEYEAASGGGLPGFSDPDGLASLVAAGELPPVEERLPVDYVVFDVKELGTYGGTLKTASVGPQGVHELYTTTGLPSLFRTDAYAQATIPYIAKGYSLSEDGRSLVITLREGLKWSDGHPFTTKDIMFWWEDVTLNEELMPVIPRIWRPGGEVASFEAIDDYTLRIEFDVPYRPIEGLLSDNRIGYLPKHALEKWHIGYNPEAEKLAKAEGFETWYQAFGAYSAYGTQQVNLELPTLAPWVLSELTVNRKLYERNPYFLGVDQQGRQLPYIDRVEVEIVAHGEIVTLMLIDGGLSLGGYLSGMTLDEYAMYLANQADGGYRSFLYPSLYTEVVFSWNQAHEDEVLREIFQDVRFRKAMSLALDRDDLNEQFMLGTGTPAQATVHPTASFYEDEWGSAYVARDLAEANRLLDEMGLTADSSGYRLRPDGERLTITILYDAAGLGYRSSAEFFEVIASHWEEVGIRVNPQSTARTLINQRAEAGELDLGVWSHPRLVENRVYFPGMESHWRPDNPALAWGVPFAQWYDTDGASGEEPPAYIKEFFEAWDRWILAETDEEYAQYAKELWDIQAEKLFITGTVAYSEWPLLLDQRLRNAPEEGFILAEPVSWWDIAYPEQWFFSSN